MKSSEKFRKIMKKLGKTWKNNKKWKNFVKHFGKKNTKKIWKLFGEMFSQK